MEDVKSKVIDILVQESIITKDYKEEDFNYDLLQSNAIDSLNIIILISIFEERFKIQFDPDDILSRNWFTVNAIVSTISQKLKSTNGK